MMCVFMICVLRCAVLYCIRCAALYGIVLQWDVVYDTMFSAVLYRALYAVWHCVVRFAEM